MKFRSLRGKFGLLLVTAIGVSNLTPASAQDEEEARQIEQIIVTAERQEASVQDTSISITAFTADTLDRFGIRNQTDLQNMIPATTIQPYDSAIRGVGRNFRNLGGDPGIATYMNGIYSEDLYTATIGSFWDIDRIEILRGPQGTLYGRNAVGGAMNFLYKKPSSEWESKVKTVLGGFNTRDYYGVVSGPVIADKLNFRLTGSSRKHDGWIEERSGLGPDLDSGDERNIALQFEWFINDNMSVHVRSNKARVDRVMGGADGGGLIVIAGENSEPGGNGQRNYTRANHALRVVDPTTVDPLASSFVDPTQRVLTYTNPSTGAPILAQYARQGVDVGDLTPNHGRGLTLDPTECLFLDRDDIDGDDLCAYTNGLNNEDFRQQGNSLDFDWEISDTLRFKYLFGYSELVYQRITEDDSTGSLIDDRQFYVNHEARYVSHEAQLFWDVNDTLSFTSGVFSYDSTINQRYDFFSSTGNSQFTNSAHTFDPILSAVAPGLISGDPALTFLAGSPAPIDLTSARAAAEAAGAPVGTFNVAVGSYLPDALGSVPNGPVTSGTDLLETNRTVRKAFAAYTQGVWDINEKYTLTFGARYAKDEVEGEEVLAQYAETMGVLDAFGIGLGLANIIRGAIDPDTLQLTGAVPPWEAGTPITFGAFRELQRVDEKVTLRVNLDYNLNDDSLIYANVTTGYRSGGFNLAFFSQTPKYEPEELIAYELGYKAQFLNNTLQFNASTYLYDYETIHTFTEEACPPGGTLLSAQSACAVGDSTASVQAAPGAEMTGLEFEVLWLATDRLTLGGNYSYTDSAYTESFIIVDGADPTIPGDIYTAETNPDRRKDVKGNRLQQVPETKLSVYGGYNYSLPGGSDLDLLASYSYIGDVYFSAFEANLDRAPAYYRVDLRATWTNPNGNWIVTGFANNIFDDIGIRQILRHGSTDGYRRTAQVTEPRMLGLEFTYSFQ